MTEIAAGNEEATPAGGTMGPATRSGGATYGLARGSEEEFLRVYDAHADEVFAFFAFRVGNQADAEDLTQVLFERALTSWHRYDPRRTKPITWLIAIARNMLIDRHRRRQTRPESLVEDFAHLENAMPSAPSAEDASRALGVEPELASALAALSDRERELIAMRYGANLKGTEIADATGLSLANVQQILSRAHRRVRETLGSPPSSS